MECGIVKCKKQTSEPNRAWTQSYILRCIPYCWIYLLVQLYHLQTIKICAALSKDYSSLCQRRDCIFRRHYVPNSNNMIIFFAGSQPGGLTNLDRKIFSCDICDWSTITYFLPTPSIYSVWDRALWSWTNPIWHGTLYYKYWAVVQRVLALWSWTSPICT